MTDVQSSAVMEGQCEYCGVVDGHNQVCVMIEVKRLSGLVKRLRKALVRIDAINDSPACFNSEIDQLCGDALTDSSTVQPVSPQDREAAND